MPAFNAEQTLSRAVSSVLEQEYSDFELIIVDDKSSDFTLDLALDFQRQDSRVSVISNAFNSRRGPIEWEPRNDGLRSASGRYIGYLDADNAWRPGFLTSLVQALDGNERLKLVYCDSCNHYSDREKASIAQHDKRKPSLEGPDWIVYSHDALDINALGTTQYIDTNELLHRSDIFKVLNYLWATWHPNREAISCAQGWIKPRRRHNDLELVERVIANFGVESIEHVRTTLVDFYYPSRDLCTLQTQTAHPPIKTDKTYQMFRYEISPSLVNVTPTESEPVSAKSLIHAIERNRDKLRHLAAEHGGVHFQGFPKLSVSEFNIIAEILGGSLLSYKGGDAPRTVLAPGIYTANDLPGDRIIPLHNEKAYSSIFPRHVLFYCQNEADHGGETTLADGRTIFRELSTQLIEDFRRRRVSYIQNLHSGQGSGKSWYETYETKSRSEVENYLTTLGAEWLWRSDGTLYVCETVSPILLHPTTGDETFFCQAHRWHISNFDEATRKMRLMQRGEFEQNRACRFGDGTQIPLNYLDEIRAVIAKITESIVIKQGDMVFLDNLVKMHGRGTYSGSRLLYAALTQG